MALSVFGEFEGRVDSSPGLGAVSFEDVIPARDAQTIELAEVISALSLALDLTEDAVPGHAVRCCLLGTRIGHALGMRDEELGDLYYSLLLKDVGCSSNAGRMCEILGGDERKAKREVKLVDWSRLTWAGISVAWGNTLPNADWPRRLRRFAKNFRERGGVGLELVKLRCERGEYIARKMGFSERCGQTIRSLDERWDGSGHPDGLEGRAIPVASQILAIAQHLEVFYSAHGRKSAMRTLTRRSGTWFDPELVRLALELDRTGRLWDGLGTADEHEVLMALEPGVMRYVGSREIDSICEGFAALVDAKSSFTYSHSLGVSKVALKIAEQMGLGPEELRLVYRASLLHDLGKLSVPNTILDKPAKLNESEWKIVRKHAQLSQAILEKIPTFAAIAQIVGRHHEKLDGSGYPLGLEGDALSVYDRIVTMADVYGAMAEDRPYRKGMSKEEIVTTLQKLVPDRLDAACFAALKQVLK